MRRLVLTLAALAVVSLAAGTALAGYGNRGYGPGCCGSYGRYGSYSRYGNYRYGYYPQRGYGYDSNSFAAAASRVRAKYSTYRYSTHPRSYYNSPPYRYDYWGW